MGAMSKRKGKCGELEASKELTRLFGVQCRRTQQYHGAAGSADLAGIEGIHPEVKRCERLSVYKAMAQAVDDAAEGDVPLVLHRSNGKEWLAVVRLDDLPELVNRLYYVLVNKGL